MSSITGAEKALGAGHHVVGAAPDPDCATDRFPEPDDTLPAGRAAQPALVREELSTWPAVSLSGNHGDVAA